MCYSWAPVSRNPHSRLTASPRTKRKKKHDRIDRKCTSARTAAYLRWWNGAQQKHVECLSWEKRIKKKKKDFKTAFIPPSSHAPPFYLAQEGLEHTKQRLTLRVTFSTSPLPCSLLL